MYQQTFPSFRWKKKVHMFSRYCQLNWAHDFNNMFRQGRDRVLIIVWKKGWECECVCLGVGGGENVKMQGNIVQVRNKRLSECLFHTLVLVVVGTQRKLIIMNFKFRPSSLESKERSESTITLSHSGRTTGKPESCACWLKFMVGTTVFSHTKGY